MEEMSHLRLFEYLDSDPDCFISGTPDVPDNPIESFMCWKMLAGVALTKEFVVCPVAEKGWQFRTIPLLV